MGAGTRPQSSAGAPGGPDTGKEHRCRPSPPRHCDNYMLTTGTDLSSMRPQDLTRGQSSQGPRSATEVWETGCGTCAKRNDHGFSKVPNKGYCSWRKEPSSLPSGPAADRRWGAPVEPAWGAGVPWPQDRGRGSAVPGAQPYLRSPKPSPFRVT